MISPAEIRNPLADEMPTPQNAALIIVDFQPVQVESIMPMEHRALVANVVAVAKTAQL